MRLVVCVIMLKSSGGAYAISSGGTHAMGRFGGAYVIRLKLSPGVAYIYQLVTTIEAVCN